MNRPIRSLAASAVLAAGLVLSAQASHAGPLVPVFPVAGTGNTFCGAGSGPNPGLGYALEYKIDAAPTPGTHTYTLVPQPSGPTLTFTVSWDPTARLLAFESPVPVGAALLKPGVAGGISAYVYAYAEPPNNAAFGIPGPFPGPTVEDDTLALPGTTGLSHVSFCVDPVLTVSKTAAGSFTRTHGWRIDKSATPTAADLFFGDSQDVDYSVEVTTTGSTDSDFAVAGTITLTNPFTGFPATAISVADVMDDGSVASVDCPATTLGDGASMVCSYSAAPADASATLNTATASYTMGGQARQSSGSAAVGWAATEVNDSIQVADTAPGAGPWACTAAAGSCSFDYSRTLDCTSIGASDSGDSGSVPNTASIVETGQSDDASVALACYRIGVTKTAATALTRTWSWGVAKSLTSHTSPVTVAVGEVLSPLQFAIVASVTGSADTGHGVQGSITVSNPAPLPAVLNSVADAFNGGALPVDCGTGFPATVAAGGTLVCSYAASLPDATGGTNTATAVQQHHRRDAEGVATATGTTSHSGSAAVDFAGATINPVDACVAVDDLMAVAGVDLPAEALGAVCVESAPKTFSFAYDHDGEPYFVDTAVCTLDLLNTAALTTADTGAIGLSEVEVIVQNASCGGDGCTLTPGYWKTHSGHGPAPYDDNWANLCSVTGAPGPACEDGPFFLSGASWYRVLWTPPAGNAYYILSHAYIATQLNLLNGASAPPEVQQAFAFATAKFQTTTPAQAAALKGAARKAWVEAAGVLDMYNNGLIGPGHCDE